VDFVAMHVQLDFSNLLLPDIESQDNVSFERASKIFADTANLVFYIVFKRSGRLDVAESHRDGNIAHKKSLVLFS
jgi:hypothetical protein